MAKIKRQVIVADCFCGLMELANAAMVLRCIGGEAEVYPCKASSLLDFLEKEGLRFRAIYIVGLPFNEGDASRARAVLVALKKAGVVVEWEANCCHRNRGAFSRQLHEEGLLTFLTESGDDIFFPKNLKKRFGIDVSDLDNFGDLVIGQKYYVSDADYWELLKAAMWIYESYGQRSLYSLAVYMLAHKATPEAWPDSVKKALAHYRRFKRRSLVGRSAAMQDVRNRVRTLAGHPDARVMIIGESGTGKETVAQQIHYGSMRQKGRFISFNCATVRSDLQESRFFGYEKGAFTGADRQTDGLFQAADGGTLFLDEIGELNMEAQGLLLRVLEEGCVQRVGGTTEIPIDVRLITATHRDLPEMVREGRFRADLFQRLSVVQIRVPPLRMHMEDIPDIVSAWSSLRQKPNSVYVEQPSDEQVAALMEYDYPGNVRELLNLLERAEVLGETDFAKLIREQREMGVGLLPAVGDKKFGESKPMKKTAPCAVAASGGGGVLPLEDAISAHVRAAYEKCGGNATETARVLKVSRNTVRKYL